MSDYWRTRLPPALTNTEALARYNSERARGIMHDPEWVAYMAEMQAFFNAGMERRVIDEVDRAPRRRWWHR